MNTKLNGEEVDLHWPDLELAVEVDGQGHTRPRTQREDALKARFWRDAGYEILRTDDLEVIRSRIGSTRPLTTS